MEGGAITMAAMMTDLMTVGTNVLSLVGDVTEVIVGNPFLLMTSGILLLGSAIGIIGRLLSRS